MKNTDDTENKIKIDEMKQNIIRELSKINNTDMKDGVSLKIKIKNDKKTKQNKQNKKKKNNNKIKPYAGNKTCHRKSFYEIFRF